MAESSSRLRLLLLLAGLAAALIIAGRSCSDGSGFSGVGRRAALDFDRHELPDLSELIDSQEAPTGGFERNPFSFYVPPTPTPTPKPSTPTPAPTTPTPIPTAGPTATPRGPAKPVPPRFNHDYLGYLGPERLKVAVFRDGDEIDVAAEGEIFAEHFIIRRIGLESVEIGYVGFPEEERTSVALIN